MAEEFERALNGLLQLTRWQDVFDVVTVAILGWIAIRFLRRSGAQAALLGLALLGAVYLAATWLDLRLTASLFRAFFAALVLVLVVVFQEDLRRFFEQLGSWRPGRSAPLAQDDTISLLVRIVAHLAERRIGALIILPGTEPLDRHVHGGVLLDGQLSEPLLLSIFNVKSPGHDGALVLRGSVVERFASHLPLSANRELLGSRGTRHAAALGLAERCDAICIVVSEERGSIAIAHNGSIQTVDVRDLTGRLARTQTEGKEVAAQVSRWRRDVWIDAAAATTAAVLAWGVFVPDAGPTEMIVSARVKISNLPADLALESIEPSEVSVTLRGLPHDLDLADASNVRVNVDGYLTRFGRRTFIVRSDDISHPDGVSVIGFAPEKLRLSMQSAQSEGVPK